MPTRSEPPPEVKAQLVPYVLSLLRLGPGEGEPVSQAALDRAIAQKQNVLLQFALPGDDLASIVLQGGRPVHASRGRSSPGESPGALLALAPRDTASLKVLPPAEAVLVFAALAGDVRRLAVPIPSAFDLPSVEQSLSGSGFSGVILIEDAPRTDIHLMRDGQINAPLASVGRLTVLGWTPRALPPLPGVDAELLARRLAPSGKADARSPTARDVWDTFEREATDELGPRAERFLIRMRELHTHEPDPARLRRRLTTELRRVRGFGHL